VPVEQWVHVSVPSLVPLEHFEVAQKQLQENRLLAKQRKENAKYLLQGLIACKHCKLAFYGKPIWYNKNDLFYLYYRCPGTDANRCKGKKICDNNVIRADLLEPAVVRALLAMIDSPGSLLHPAQRGRTLSPQQKQERLKAYRLFSSRLAELTPQLVSDLCHQDRLIQRNALRMLVKRIDIDYFEVIIILRPDCLAPLVKPVEAENTTSDLLCISLPRTPGRAGTVGEPVNFEKVGRVRNTRKP
jgi:hypothetical protein